ncbi:MAG: hypothetical protein A2Z34_07160 [Planctomycetes bacterium RBG_16_59_8]|nr:MAG: hypothetical protein A2Z34_07160 [Planctomycetes bacterium RBG_16_59_8]
MAQLAAAAAVDRTGKRKAITVWSIVVARQVWWLIPILLFLPGGWRLTVFIVLVLLSNVATVVATPGWFGWMADIIHERIQKRYFGTRNAAVAAATVVATMGGGLYLDVCLKSRCEAERYAIIFGVSAFCALVAVVLLRGLPPGDERKRIDGAALERLAEPLRDRPFRGLLSVFVVWNFALGVAAAFFAAHMILNLKMTFTQISLYFSSVALVGVALSRPWGIMIERFGCRPVMVVCAFGTVLIPLIWCLPTPQTIWILIPESIYAGALWAGFNLALFNVPLAYSPKEGRANYLAVFSVVTGLSFFAASIVGGLLAEGLAGSTWNVLGGTLVNYHVLFLISAALRIIAAFLFLTVREPKEKGVIPMMQFMGDALLRRMASGRQFLPWISPPAGEGKR